MDNRIDQEDKGKVIPKDIRLEGIQYQGQAQRELKYMEAAIRYNAIQASWTGFLDARHLRVGQVVRLFAKAALYQGKKFRLTKIKVLDAGSIQFTGVEYHEGIYDDRLAGVLASEPQPDGPNVFNSLSDVANLAIEEYGYQQALAL